MPGLVHVIDDDACFLKAMERRLKHAGYEVATYASSQHLLDRLPSESVPSCILLDVQIPGLDGPALQSRLSELGSTLPIIFLTGHPDIPTTVRTIKAGANDFLTKPVSSDELLRAIERAIGHHEATFGLKSEAGHGSRSYRNIDAARAGSLRTSHSRRHQQANRPRVRLCRTNSQSPSPQGDGEKAGPHLGGVGLRCRTSRRLCVGCRGRRSRSLSDDRSACMV